MTPRLLTALLLTASAAMAGTMPELPFQPKVGVDSILGGGCTATAAVRSGDTASLIIARYFGGSRARFVDANDGKHPEFFIAKGAGTKFCISEWAD